MQTRLYQTAVMEHVGANRAIRGLRHQEMAQFARRAHRQLGRGFVLFDDIEAKPVYITRLTGAPQCLIEVVLGYDPTREAVVVSEDDNGRDAITIDRVTILSAH